MRAKKQTEVVRGDEEGKSSWSREKIRSLKRTVSGNNETLGRSRRLAIKLPLWSVQ